MAGAKAMLARLDSVCTYRLRRSRGAAGFGSITAAIRPPDRAPLGRSAGGGAAAASAAAAGHALAGAGRRTRPRVLTRRPTECLATPKDAETAYLVELGRAAFRTPLLLGGQARAGRARPARAATATAATTRTSTFPGVSGAPGTADVTTSVLSSHEMNSVHGAKPIPDLSGPKSALKFDQDPATGAARGARSTASSPASSTGTSRRPPC